MFVFSGLLKWFIKKGKIIGKYYGFVLIGILIILKNKIILSKKGKFLGIEYIYVYVVMVCYRFMYIMVCVFFFFIKIKKKK